MTTTIDQIHVGNAEGGDLEVTLRGEPKAIINALAQGLSDEDLRRIEAALADELKRRAGGTEAR
jgi:hypothetical protein